MHLHEKNHHYFLFLSILQENIVFLSDCYGFMVQLKSGSLKLLSVVKVLFLHLLIAPLYYFCMLGPWWQQQTCWESLRFDGLLCTVTKLISRRHLVIFNILSYTHCILVAVFSDLCTLSDFISLKLLFLNNTRAAVLIWSTDFRYNINCHKLNFKDIPQMSQKETRIRRIIHRRLEVIHWFADFCSSTHMF